METSSKNVGQRARHARDAEVRDASSRATDMAKVRHTLEATPFTPHPLYRNAHAQTILGSLRPEQKFGLFRKQDGGEDEARLIEIEPGIQLLAHCGWQTDRERHPTLLLVHGLEGSSAAAYMVGTARKAYSAGFNVVRLNVRNCGDTEHLTPTLYHSGMSGDIHTVVRQLIERDRLSSIFLAGFSLGGNLVLKFAGEAGDSIPREVAGVAAISPSLDLAACTAAIELSANRLYQWRFMRSLRRRVRRKEKLFPHLYDTGPLRRVRTIRQFDETYTATHGGFRDAADYYARSSALGFIEHIRVPTLIIHAQDDPFVPFASFRHAAISSNPNVILLAPPHGGHVGFVARPRRTEDRYWAESRVVEFCGLIQGLDAEGAKAT